MTVLAACPYLAGCHPHHHAWIHPGGGVLGGLLFAALIGYLWDLRHGKAR